MSGASAFERLLRGAAGCAVVTAIAGAGCASVEYRVPSWEAQRLAELPPAARGAEVRVVPANVVAPPAPAPAPEVAVEPPPGAEVGLAVEVDGPIAIGGPEPIGRPRPIGAPPYPTGTRGALGAPVRPTPVPAMAGSGWRAAAAAPPRPTPNVRAASPLAGGHHGGGGGHGNSGAAVAGAVAVVGLVVLIAEASAAAAAADQARRFDGWIAVQPTHPLRLYYVNGQKRRVALTQLAPPDLLGLQYAVVSADDGPVEVLPPAPSPPPPSPPPPSP